MIRCPNCKTFVQNDSAAYCPGCKHLFEADEPTSVDEATGGSPAKYKSTYETARTLAQLVSALGWVVVLVGTLAMASIITEVNRNGGGPNAILLGMLPLAGVILVGLITAATGQIYRAVVDTADHTGEMLHLMRNGRDQ